MNVSTSRLGKVSSLSHPSLIFQGSFLSIFTQNVTNYVLKILNHIPKRTETEYENFLKIEQWPLEQNAPPTLLPRHFFPRISEMFVYIICGRLVHNIFISLLLSLAGCTTLSFHRQDFVFYQFHLPI